MSDQNGNGNRKGKYTEIARAFRAAHGNKDYTMIWDQTLEAEMNDKSLAKEARVLAAIRRYSWGNYCDFAVDGLPAMPPDFRKPTPLTQEALGEILSIPKSSIGRAVTFLLEQGYLKQHRFLCPEENLDPLESTKNSGVNPNSWDNHSPFLRFRRSYLAEHQELQQSIAEVDETRNKLREAVKAQTEKIRQYELEILSAYRDFEREQKAKTDVTEDGTESDPNSVQLSAEVDPILQQVSSPNSRKESKPNPGRVDPVTDSSERIEKAPLKRSIGIREKTDAAAASFPVSQNAAAALPDLSPILEAFEPFGGISEDTAALLLERCAPASPRHIAAATNEISIGEDRKNPIGILLVEIPKRFKSGRPPISVEPHPQTRPTWETPDLEAIQQERENRDRHIEEQIAALGPDWQKQIQARIKKLKKDWPLRTQQQYQERAEAELRTEIAKSLTQ